MTIERTLTDKVKQAIRKEYKYLCQYCNNKKKKAIHVEHIVSLNKGGTDDLNNLTLACESCNLKKSDLDLPETYSGILLARSKQKRKKIENRINNGVERFNKSGDSPSDFFIENIVDKDMIRKGSKFLKINTSEEYSKYFTTLYKQQNKIFRINGENFIEHQTYKWNSLFGEHFHNIFKRMMYVNIEIVEYERETGKFKKISSENLIEGIRYEVNEYVKLYISNRLSELIKNNTIFEFKDIINGKEMEHKNIRRRIKNPFL